MIQHIQEQQSAICAVLAESRDRTICSLLPENEEWSTIEDLISVFKAIFDDTAIMSGSRYPTFLLLAPLLYKFNLFHIIYIHKVYSIYHSTYSDSRH